MTTPPTPHPAHAVPPLAVLALGGSVASVAVGNSLAQGLFDQVGTTGAVALRNLVGAAVLLAVYRPFGRRTRPFTRRALCVIAGYGTLLGLMNELFYRALLTLPIGLAVGIEFTGPLLVAVCTSRRPADLLWVALAATGIVLITPPVATMLPPTATSTAISTAISPAGWHRQWDGILYALAAGATWGGYMLLGRRAGQSHGGGAAALGLGVAALVSIPIALATHTPALAPGPWPALAGRALLVGLLAGAVPYGLEIYALARMPARNYGLLVSTEPAICALTGLVLLGQHLTPAQMLAILLLIAASAGATLGARGDRRAGDDAKLPVEGPV